MAISNCVNEVDALGREIAVHGTRAFPIGCYYDDLSKEEVPWQWHEEMEAALVTEGEAFLLLENERILLKEGDGFFINSGYLHACEWNGPGICRFHSMCFAPVLIGGEKDSVFWKKYLTPFLDDPAQKYLVLCHLHGTSKIR